MAEQIDSGQFEGSFPEGFEQSPEALVSLIQDLLVGPTSDRVRDVIGPLLMLGGVAGIAKQGVRGLPALIPAGSTPGNFATLWARTLPEWLRTSPSLFPPAKLPRMSPEDFRAYVKLVGPPPPNTGTLTELKEPPHYAHFSEILRLLGAMPAGVQANRGRVISNLPGELSRHRSGGGRLSPSSSYTQESLDKIDKALTARYRELARELHPDRGGNPEDMALLTAIVKFARKSLEAHRANAISETPAKPLTLMDLTPQQRQQIGLPPLTDESTPPR